MRLIDFSTLIAGETAALGDGPLHDDVAVEDPAHGVGDRLVVVVAIDQHGEEQPGDRASDSAVGPCGARAGALQQLRQFGEDGGRVAARGRRLAGGQADLALGHGEAGDAVHQAQHLLEVLVAQELGQGHGHIGRLAPLQRRLVRGGDDDDGAL